MSWGLRGSRSGLWVDNRYKEILVIGFYVQYGVNYITFNEDDNIRSEPVESFKKRINHDHTGELGY